MHYFYAEANRSLPPIRTGIGVQGKKWNEKFFKPVLIERLVRLLNDLQPFDINFLFIDNVPLIDLSSPLRSFGAAKQLLREEAGKPEDCELIWFMFSQKIMNLEITQSIAIRKFVVHDTKNLFIRCCARTLLPGCKFEPEKILKQLQQGYKFLIRWLNEISKHEVFKEWGILPKFQTWQEIEIPPELIIKTGMYGKRLPFPGEPIKNPAHELPLKLAWFLKNCQQPKTKITADGETLFLPNFSRFLATALENNPIHGITAPLIKKLMPKQKS